MAQGYYGNGMMNAYPTQTTNMYQQYQQPRLDYRPIVSHIPGHIINAPEEVRPNEIPMDGSIALFPTADFGCIYAKQWNTDGTITTVRFVKEQPSEPVTKPDSYEALINRRFNELKDLICKSTGYVDEGGANNDK